MDGRRMRGTHWRERLAPYRRIAGVVLLGCLLLLLPGRTAEEPTVSQDGEEPFSLSAVETEMEELLRHMEGVGELHLMLTLQSGTALELATNGKLSEQEGGAYTQETETVLLSQGGNVDEALVIGSVYPRYQGAVVVCEGADRASVRLAVTEAVSALTGLGADAISVLPMGA